MATKLIFKNGVFSSESLSEKDIMFLTFNHANADSEKYNILLKALPRIKGLKSGLTRRRFVMQMIENMKK